MSALIRCGDIGEDPREYEFEPFPESVPLAEPAPIPEPVTVPAEPIGVPA